MIGGDRASSQDRPEAHGDVRDTSIGPQDVVTKLELTLQPDPRRTVIRPFEPGDPAGVGAKVPRVRRIADRIAGLPDERVNALCGLLRRPLAERMVEPEARLRERFEAVRRSHDLPALDPQRAVLAGAYFSQEYAFESAALFNPSVIPHPDQAGLADGEIRLLMSLRGVGEGHISSVTFRVLRWRPGSEPILDPVGERAVMPIVEHEVEDRTIFSWPESIAPADAVLFPVTDSQRQGIEDARFVRFTEEDGSSRVFATYTAFDGREARSEMLETLNGDCFTLRPLTGACVRNKGMALFPRRIGGRFAMLSRLDNENIYLMRSNDPYRWEEAELLLRPQQDWEFVQIGNCGSPIELDEGWLVLTHGVGVMRSYSIGAVLLDKNDPTRVLARTPQPLLRPHPEERGGYVPNVVYSCGGLVHDRVLLLPYAVSDRYTAFATAPVDRVLAAME